MADRLQKVLARAGLASRRKAEEIILAGRVVVNGQRITTLGTVVDPVRDKIRVDGQPLPQPEPIVYLVNKPAGVVTTSAQEEGRSRVIDLVPAQPRVYPVGRLDRTTEGLILLTNDGDLAEQLAHPRLAHRKEYEVTGVTRRPVPELIEALKKGVRLDGDLVVPDKVTFGGVRNHRLTILMEVHEGRHHLIKRLCARAGLEITRLVRVRVGSLTLKDLALGQYRRLTPNELATLRFSTRRSPAGEPLDQAKPSAGQRQSP